MVSRPQIGRPTFRATPPVLSEEDEHRYVAGLKRNGFFGPDSWYMNWQANVAYAERAKANWRLNMPVLFLHGAYDYVCETLAGVSPNRCAHTARNLTEVTSFPAIGWRRRSRSRSMRRWRNG